MNKKHKCCECGCEAKWKLKPASKGKLFYYCNKCLPTLKIKDFNYNENGFSIIEDENKPFVLFEDVDSIKKESYNFMPFNEQISINTVFYLTIKFCDCKINDELIDYNKFMCKVHKQLIELYKEHKDIDYPRFFRIFKSKIKLKKSFI